MVIMQLEETSPNEVKRLSPSFLKTINKLKRSMREKKDLTNNSRESKTSIDWRDVIDGSFNKSKEVVNPVDRIDKPLRPIAVSITIEENDKVHRSDDLNESKVMTMKRFTMIHRLTPMKPLNGKT